MATAGLWRTGRPRFPMYSSDGRGRDYYIKFDNGGYWADQFKLKKVPDYERPRYKNYHTLFHHPAPFKYWGNGHGRETYILQQSGFFHDQKPLCSYKLIDFLRTNETDNRYYNSYKKNLFLSVSEKKYNKELKRFEKKLIKRLYTDPLNMKKSMKSISFNKNNNDSSIEKKEIMGRTITDFHFNNNNTESLEKSGEENIRSNTLGNIRNENIYKNIYNNNSIKNKKMKNNKLAKFNRTFDNFYKNNLKTKNLKFRNDNNSKHDDSSFFNNKYKTFKELLNYNRINTTADCKSPENIKFLEPRERFNQTMKAEFNFKPKPKRNVISLKKFNFS